MHATAAQPVANIDLEQFDDGRHGAARDHSKRTSELQTYLGIACANLAA